MESAGVNINNQFFDSSYKHAWKQLIPAGLTEAEVDFIIEVGHLDPNSSVLDIMCGYGRHALELSRRGIPVTAIDNLEYYIKEITELSFQESLPVEPLLADVLHVQLEKQYDMAICMGNSFAFFNQQEAISILKNISSHLKSQGSLIINSWMIAEIAIRHFKEKDWHYAGDFKCILEYNYCFNPSRIESEQTIISNNGIVEKLKGIDYVFTINELSEMFRQSGLKIKDAYSTPRKRKFSLGDAQIYIVAEKLTFPD